MATPNVWAVIDQDGNVLAAYDTEKDAREALPAVANGDKVKEVPRAEVNPPPVAPVDDEPK